MATRLFFRNTTNGTGGLPTAEQSTQSSDKDAESQTTNRTLSTTKGVSQIQLTLATLAASTVREYYFTRFVSAPLNMSSISANTWTYTIATLQSNNNADFPCSGANQPVWVNCYVWRPSTSTKVGTIRDGTTASTIDEFTANQEVYQVTTFSGSAVSSMVAGDVLVFEVWFNTTQDSATSYNVSFYYDGVTEGTHGSGTSSAATYIETPQNLTFYTTTPVSQSNIQKYAIRSLIAPATSIHKYDIFSASTVQANSIHKYKIINSSEGFSVFMRLYVPFISNESGYGKRAVLFSKLDNEQVTYGYAAHLADDGTLSFYVRDNSRDYSIDVPANLPVLGSVGDPDYSEVDFNSTDYFTIFILGDLIPKPIPYTDLAFTYEFLNHRMQIIRNGDVIADSFNAPVPRGLAGRWVLNEGTGTVANNNVRGVNNGTINNATWEALSGRNYLRFQATNNGVKIPNYPDIAILKKFTISLWYYPIGVPSVDGYLARAGVTGAANSFLVYHQNSGFCRLSIWDHLGTRHDATFSSAFPSLNQWYHVTARWNGVGTPPEITVNDATMIVGSTTIPSTEITPSIGFEIGQVGAGTVSPNGYIRDVSFYNIGIDDTDITTLFNSKDNYPLRDNLVAEFKLNEGGDIGNQPVEPSSFIRRAYNGYTTGNNGTITGATWTQITNKPHETYLNFNGGTNNYVLISNYTAIQNVTELTVSVWLRPAGNPIQGGFLNIINKNWANNGAWILYLDNPSGTTRIVFATKNDAGTTYSMSVSNPFTAGLNQWYHIVARFKVGGTLSVNVNNVKTTGGSQSGSISTGSTNLSISASSNSMNGIIHDVKVWNRELTDKEVEYLYTQGHLTAGFPSWQAEPPPPPETPVPITNPFTTVYDLPNPFNSTWQWQTLHKLIASGFTEQYNIADGTTIPESVTPFSTVYTNTVSGGGGGGGGLTNFIDIPNNSSGSHVELFSGDIIKAGTKVLSGHAAIGKIITKVTPRGRKEGSPTGTIYCKIWDAGGVEKATIGSYSTSSWTTSDADQPVFQNDSNTYVTAVNDIIGFEYSGGSSSNNMALVQNTTDPPASTQGMVFEDSWANYGDNIGMKVEGITSGAGSGQKLFFTSHTGASPPNWNDEAQQIVSQHMTNTSSGMFDKPITRVTLTPTKVGTPGGNVAIQIRDGDSSVVATIGTFVAADVTGSPIVKTNLNNTWKMTSADKVAIVASAGDAANYFVIPVSGTSQVTNSAIRTLKWNRGGLAFPSGGSYTWADELAQDMTATFETGGVTIPEKKHWFSLNGTTQGVGERLINVSSILNGDKITRVKPKLRNVGNATGTISVKIRSSSMSGTTIVGGTIVDTVGTIEADSVGPDFVEKEFTDLLQGRVLTAGDMIMIEYTGTPTQYIDVMVKWDNGAALGNEQLVTWNGSAFTAQTGDLCGKIFTGGTPTDATARLRASEKADTEDSILRLSKPSRVKVWLRKVGNPPNNVSVRVRRESDDSSRALIGTIAASTLSTSAGGAQHTFTASPVSVYAMGLNDSLSVEYDDGDDTNYVQVGITNTQQIDGIKSHLIMYDGLFQNYDVFTDRDLIATVEEGGDSFTPSGDEIPPPPPPKYTHDLHIMAGGHPWSYYTDNDNTTIENWISVIAPDIRWYRKILTAPEAVSIYLNRRDRSAIAKGQIAVIGFFSLPPFS